MELKVIVSKLMELKIVYDKKNLIKNLKNKNSKKEKK